MRVYCRGSSDVRAILVTSSSDFNMHDGALSELNSDQFPSFNFHLEIPNQEGGKSHSREMKEAKKAYCVPKWI